jgi:hypothetical protein
MQRRDAVLRAMRDHPISQRRACVLIGVDPKTVRRERPPDHPDIRKEMRKIAEKRRRFEQYEDSAPGALSHPETNQYQPEGLSL